MTPRLLRYFNKGFYAGTGRWSHQARSSSRSDPSRYLIKAPIKKRS